MAIDSEAPVGYASGLKFKSRHWTVGAMVVISVALMLLLVVLLQRWAFQSPLKWDLTSSRINSLSGGTIDLLDKLGEEQVRLTSLYFETDLEHESQKKYRQSVKDLLRLYQSQNPRQVQTDFINPLQEQPKFTALMTRLSSLPRFQGASAPYLENVERFLNDIYPAFKEQIQGLLSELQLAGEVDTASPGSLLLQVQRAVQSWIMLGDQVAEQLTALQDQAAAQYSAGTRAIEDFYTQIGERAKAFGANVAPILGQQQLAPGIEDVLQKMTAAMTEWSTRFDAEKESLGRLQPLALENLLGAVQSRNVLIVETTQSAKALSFEELWPPLMDGSFAGDNEFEKRRFAGEGAITPAILQLIQDDKTAIVFVRSAGAKLFGAAGFGLNARLGPMNGLKGDLEKLNYVVAEWDVAAGTTPPEFEETPRRTIYVVMRPQPKLGPQGPMPGPRLGPVEQAAVLDALTKSGRALFLAGWDLEAPAYEYGEYLKSKWGLEVTGKPLVITAIPTAPNEWQINPRSFVMLRDIEFAEHDEITTNLNMLDTVFPRATPLGLTEDVPQGITIRELGEVPKSEDVWAIRDYRAFAARYDESRNEMGLPITHKMPDDISGPFPVFVAAEKEATKIAVLGVHDTVFADEVAGKNRIVMAGGGIMPARAFPGNFALLVNVLHYLDDTMEWVRVGSPIDQSKIQMNQRQLVSWRVVVVGLWPALAMAGGIVVWLIRRR